MTVKIISFSTTPLAGAPIRIAQALNRHTHLSVRHVDLRRWGIFDHDHVHQEEPEETLALAEDADIIHLFNAIDIRSPTFAPVEFEALQKKGKKLIRMFESTPMLVASQLGITASEVVNDPIPKLVIAQYPERFFPDAFVVPNIIPQDSPAYRPDPEVEVKWGAVYSPTKTISAWDARWDTKGMPETVDLLGRVQSAVRRPIGTIHGRSLAEVLEAKREAAVIVDDLVTGSYHLSGLEGLSLGKPVVSFLDDRNRFVLSAVTGSSLCPFVNVRLEDAETVLCYLLSNPAECSRLGHESRKWVEGYYSDRQLVQHYTDAYGQLLEDPSKVVRQPELELDSPLSYYQAVSLPDQIYEGRRGRWLRNEGPYDRSRRYLQRSVPRMAGCLANCGLRPPERAKVLAKRILHRLLGGAA